MLTEALNTASVSIIKEVNNKSSKSFMELLTSQVAKLGMLQLLDGELET